MNPTMIEPNDTPEPPPEELDMAAEDATGKYLSGPPAERIAGLTKRIEYLKAQIKKTQHEPERYDAKILRDLRKGLQHDLTRAEAQLKDWQTQQDGRT
jgi:hypothetical protein